MKVFLSMIILACSINLNGYSQHEYFVSPLGNDRNSGTRGKPFKTIRQAQKEVRKVIAIGQKGDITVWIASGNYQLTEPLKFGPEDSGNEDFQIIYRKSGDTNPVISGGIEIKGWKKSENGIWVANIPKTVKHDFRELFIDGRRAIRARHPDNDFLRMVAVGEDRRTNFRFNTGDFPKPDQPQQVELVIMHDWSISRIPVDRINYSDNSIFAIDTIGARCLDFFNLDNWEKNPRYFLENSLTFLNSPFEWYIDSNKALIYLMLPKDQDANGRHITLPVLGPHLVEIDGNVQQNVRNLTFEGLSFQYCSWTLPEKGYAGIQACHYDIPGNKATWKVVLPAVFVKYSENCIFNGCDFKNLGGSGLWFGAGCRNCEVNNSHFEEISGNGMMIGEGNTRNVNGVVWWKTVPDQVASNNKISHNVINDCGKQFYGAVGIWCGFTAGTIIDDNQIYNLPYTGISIGWEWSPVATPCRDNQLTGNHIHHIMNVLSDGGGIYMLGLQPGSVISKNLIHDVKINAGRAESNGMFLDEGSTDLIISGNIIYNIAKSPLRFHQATTNIVRDNVLSCTVETPPVRYNATSYEDIRLENNRILMDLDIEHQRLLREMVEKWESDKN